MRDNSAGTMERKRQIDREIRALESELLGHIDSELCRLGALLRHANRNWISMYATDMLVDAEVVDGFAKRILDKHSFLKGVLDKGSTIAYIQRFYAQDYEILSGLYKGNFDSDLLHAVLNADCLSSKINFLNRLRSNGFLHLGVSAENICNPDSDTMLGAFKLRCKNWIDEWKKKCGNNSGGTYPQMTSEQRSIALLSLGMMQWIEHVETITDAAKAREILFSAYGTTMTSFEELRKDLDSRS